MWNLSQAQYKLEFIASDMNIPGLSAVLKDNFLNTSTAIDLSGSAPFYYNFSVSAPGSKARDRFKIVFLQTGAGPTPVNFVSLSANRLGEGVKVDWKVAAEREIRSYEIERSTDGRRFTTAGTVTANGNSSREMTYTWLDATPLSGSSFYRIKSVGVGGEIKYSYIAKVSVGEVKPGYTISPNPVEGSVVNIQFKNQPKGRYNIRLLSDNGQVMFTTIAEHAGGNSNQVLNLPGLIARGGYQLEIISPEKVREVQTLFINTK
jgi:hypothetical protein